MAKRLLLPLALVLIAAAPALAGDGYGDQKAKVDAKLAHLQAKIAVQHRQEQALNSQIAGLTSQITTLERRGRGGPPRLPPAPARPPPPHRAPRQPTHT